MSKKMRSERPALDGRIQFPLLLFAAALIASSFTGFSWTGFGLFVAALTWTGFAFGKAALRRFEYRMLVGGVGCLAFLKFANGWPQTNRAVSFILAGIIAILIIAVFANMFRLALSVHREIRALRKRLHSVKPS